MQNQQIRVNTAVKRCPYCGEEVPVNVQKCSHCGEWLIVRYGKSWVSTLLLCSFLGCFGVHNFYNNKTGIAVAQLVLSLTFIGLLITLPWALVETYIILCDGYTDSEGKKLSKKPTIQSTALLCFFFGIIGWHRFYTGHIGLAFLQLFTCGGFFIWTFIDFILILTGNFKDAEGRLIRG